jgi:hypothetical protein
LESRQYARPSFITTKMTFSEETETRRRRPPTSSTATSSNEGFQFCDHPIILPELLEGTRRDYTALTFVIATVTTAAAAFLSIRDAEGPSVAFCNRCSNDPAYQWLRDDGPGINRTNGK